MSKTMAAFYEGPPYLEMLNRIQRQIDLMTRPLLDTQQDYAALTRNCIKNRYVRNGICASTVSNSHRHCCPNAIASSAW